MEAMRITSEKRRAAGCGHAADRDVQGASVHAAQGITTLLRIDWPE
jgi:hypothetical protein